VPPSSDRDDLQGALFFLANDLARLVDRLSTFGAERLTTVGLQASDRRALLAVGQRLLGVAIALAVVGQAEWLSAAARYKEQRGRRGWSATCANIAQRQQAMDDVAECARQLRAAAVCLDESGRSDCAATVSAQTRKAQDALLAAATCWNRATSRVQP
jgi:hypothetical protein